MRAHAARDPPKPPSRCLAAHCREAKPEAPEAHARRTCTPHGWRVRNVQSVLYVGRSAHTCLSLRVSPLLSLELYSMERELFSLVCCLLRLVSLFRESSLLNYCNHNGSPAHTPRALERIGP